MRCALAIVLLCTGACAHGTPPVAPPRAGPRLQLELGRWTVAGVDRLLAEAHERHAADANARLAFVMERFLATPFGYESQLDLPPKGTMRVRLESFGCTGFVITMLAMSSARSFAEFTENLRRIRYLDSDRRGVDSDPATGNILDFAYDIFLDSAVGQGFARDITADIAGGDGALTTFRARFTARRRTVEYDVHRRLIVPKLHRDQVVAARMITTAAFARRVDRSRIRTGDILLFSRVDPRKPVGETLLIGHMGIAVKRGGEIYLIHATRDYVWRPDATRGSKPIRTGRYYLDDPRREQLGVGPATKWVDDPAGKMVMIRGRAYHGYSPTELRPVHDYMAGAHFRGVMILRPRLLSP